MIDEDPIAAVSRWYDEEGELHESFIQMATLATISPAGCPTLRQIEIPSFDDEGAAFFTHRSSRKAAHLVLNPKAALNIWLPHTKRQVSIEGEAKEMVPGEARQWWERMPLVLQRCFLDDDCDESESMPHEFMGFRLLPRRFSFYEIRFPEVSDNIVMEKRGSNWVLTSGALL